jgi:cadmium resistance protein CadD (predicted permease)
VVAIIGMSIACFVVTNLDDLFVLLGFFSAPNFRARDVLIGQLIGMAVIISLSLLFGWAASEWYPSFVRFLGVLPITVGLKALWDLRVPPEDPENYFSPFPRLNRTCTVAAVTLANGGDNIGVYAPLFSVHTGLEQTVIVVIFLVLTLIWCALARYLVKHPLLGRPIRLYGRYAFPVFLIGLGTMILLGH